MRISCLILLVVISSLGYGQHISAFGIFGGVSIPITIDTGLKEDPRFQAKLNFRAIPIGFSYSYDFSNTGLVITPSYVQIGQQYIINNIMGGSVGIRDIKMDYICLPVALKVFLTNFSFIRLHLVTALNVGYLVRGRETLSFAASTLRYPSGVYIPTDPGYEQRPDGGVATPEVNNQIYVSHDKFKPVQLFFGLGVRSDIDLSDKWGITLDARVNGAVFDSRTTEYKGRLDQPETPDLNGIRRDLYLSIEIGFVRIMTIRQRAKVSRSNEPIPKQKYKRPKW